MIDNQVFKTMIESPVRSFRGRIEVYSGSDIVLICGCHDRLKGFTIERLGENKFFGYGICQKLNVKLLDPKRELSITTANTLEVEFGVESNYIYPCPNFYVTQVYRDEKTNELSITAYDALYPATKYTVADLGLTGGYTIREFVTAAAAYLGLPVAIEGNNSLFNLAYEGGANFDGTETLRAALNAAAEATHTIYYVNHKWELVFKTLSRDGAADLTIDKAKQVALDSGDNRRFAQVTHTTELGDNVSATIAASGSTQYLRENPFLNLRDDIGDILDSIIDSLGGLTINQFACYWRGNFLLEIGDKIELITKDDKSVFSFLLNDTMTFNGALAQDSSWEFTEDELETETNSTNLGEALRRTYARVDKANNRIDLVASEAAENTEAIAALQLSTEGITATVERVETEYKEAVTGVKDDINTLTQSVEAKVSAEDVTIAITESLANGVDTVTTATGFTFNSDGLTISKSGKEMQTTITEDGMQVFKDGEAVLTANNEGVDAVNLRASTYIIIGNNSRFEDYNGRTGCFWVGD
jgi:hypothetical protein